MKFKRLTAALLSFGMLAGFVFTPQLFPNAGITACAAGTAAEYTIADATAAPTINSDNGSLYLGGDQSDPSYSFYSGRAFVTGFDTPKPNLSAKLTWDTVAGAEKYAVYKINNDNKAVKLKETTKKAINIVNLKPGKTYKYAVKAYVDGKWTTLKKSDVVTVKTEK